MGGAARSAVVYSQRMSEAPAPRTRRWLKPFLLGALAGGLVVGVGIAVPVAVTAQRQAAYESCLAAHGYDPRVPITDIDQLDQFLEDTADC